MLEAPAASKISKAAILLRDGQYDDKTTSLDLHCKRGTLLKCERCHFQVTFQQGHHFSISWSPGECDVLPSLKNQSSFYCTCNEPKHGKKKKL